MGLFFVLKIFFRQIKKEWTINKFYSNKSFFRANRSFQKN